MQLAEQISKKWEPVLDHPDLPKIEDPYRRAVTAMCLENVEAQYAQDQNGGLLTEGTNDTFMGTTTAVSTGGAAGATDAGQAAIKFADPVLISMVRRAMPQLIAYDVCGVQPMSGPTGLIFALRSRIDTQADGAEAFYNEALTSTSGAAGDATGDATDVPSLLVGSTTNAHYTTGTGMTTAVGEALTPASMSFSIEKVSVAAGTRALKGSYSMELAQDLRAVHGLDAEAELANILSGEILAEINREVIRRIYINAISGSALTTTPGTFDLDTDSNGRWMVEKFKGLMMNIERDANAIAKGTRRGKGNIILTSSDVASALQMAGILDHGGGSSSLSVDETSSTFAGVLNGRYKVYVDPYAAANATEYYCVGYKGPSPMDAGIFYCPYVPLQMVRAVDGDTFQPKIAFKTRYGIVANPFSQGLTAGAGNVSNLLASTAPHTNEYYRISKVSNLM